jgi:hypothetical protein
MCSSNAASGCHQSLKKPLEFAMMEGLHPSENAVKKIRLTDWSEFENILREELRAIAHHGPVTVRNFQLVTFTDGGDELDRLAIALSTGTDRDGDSPFWNATGFDHEHDRHPTGKRADEIIYAFTIDLSHAPYLVHHDATPEAIDITEPLSEHDGVIVYESQKLERRTKNEYWFKTTPLDAALMIFTLAANDD